MGLFITEAKSVVLASLIIVGSSAVGCSDSPTVRITFFNCPKTENASVVDSPTIGIDPLELDKHSRNVALNPRNLGSWSNSFTPTAVQDQDGVWGESNTAWTLGDDNAVDYEYKYGSGISAPSDTSWSCFSVYIKKDSDVSRFPAIQFMFSGGPPYISVVLLLNTSTGSSVVLGGSTGTYSTGVEDHGTWWRPWIAIQNDAAHSSLLAAVMPAYSTVWNNAEPAATGTIVVDAAQVEKGRTYPSTYSEPTIITIQDSNAVRIDPLVVSISDKLNASDSITVEGLDLNISKTDSVAVSEQPTNQVGFLVVSKSETVGVTDTPSELLHPLVITKTETIRIKEGRQRSSLWPTKEEVVAVADSPTVRLAFLKISQSDSVGIADSKTLTHDLRISRSDLISALDSSAPKIDPLIVTFCDNVSATDQGTQSCDLEVSRTDKVGVVGVDATRIDPLLVAGADAVEVSDALVGVTDIIGAVSDGAEVADSNIVFVEGAEFYKPVLSDEVGVNDSAEVWLDALVVVKAERISVAEARSFINDLAVWKTENLKVTSSLQVFTNDLSVLQTDQVSVNDGTGSAEVDLDKRDLESVSISERITIQFTAAGAVKSDEVGISDSPNVWVPPFPRGRDDVGISEARTLGFDPLRVSGTEQVGITDGLVGTRFSLLVSKTDQVSLSEVRTGLPETVDLSIHKTERVSVQSVKTVTSTVFLLLEDDVYYLCLEGGTSAATHWGGRIILWGSTEEETTELNITTFEEHPEISDSPTVRLAQAVVTPSEEAAISEVRDVRLGALLVSASESVGVADSKVVGLVTPVYPTVSDGASVSDSASVRLGALLATGTDEIGVSEGLRIGLTPLELSQSDAIEVADTQDLRIGDVVELASDTVEIADTPIVALQLVRDFSDGAEIGDSPTIALAELVVGQSDGVGIAEAIDRNLDLLASRSDGVGVSEATERSLDLMVSGSDEVRITEATIRSFDLSVSGSDGIEAGEAGERRLDLMASRSDEVGISDTSASWIEPAFLYVTAAEQVGVSEARVLTPDLRVSRTDSVGISEVRLARLDLRVTRSDGVGISEAKVFGFNLVELRQSESVGVSDRKMVYVRLVPGTGHWIPEGLLRGAYRLKLVT